MNIPGITSYPMTVVIPTYNRMNVLDQCLKHLERQSFRDFKVVVVNDGSTDATEELLSRIQQTSSLHLQVLHQDNAGPARARNFALQHVSTPLCLLIGDDILAGPRLLEAHLRFHETHLGSEAVGLGWTTWDESHQAITPFMRWYEAVQFRYDRLLAGEVPTWQHFYTSNLSCKTSLFQDNQFDERFRAAAWEDIELGFRLFQSGKAALTFLPDANATHVHPTTFPQAIKRMQTLGKSQRLFHQLWPQARISKSDLKTTLCLILAQQSLLLRGMTALSQYVKPGKLHAMLLRSYFERAYRQAASE